MATAKHADGVARISSEPATFQVFNLLSVAWSTDGRSTLIGVRREMQQIFGGGGHHCPRQSFFFRTIRASQIASGGEGRVQDGSCVRAEAAPDILPISDL